jgi:hypothetical protein
MRLPVPVLLTNDENNFVKAYNQKMLVQTRVPQ